LDLEEVGAGLGTGLFILAMAGNSFSSCPLAAILFSSSLLKPALPPFPL